MTTVYNTNVVRGGLMLYIDAANPKSYPGTGTAVTDLSGFGRHCTMNNGTSFDAANGGSFSYDGTNDSITTNAAQNYITTLVTADIWVKVDGHGNFHNFINNNWVNNGWLIYTTTTNWTCGIAQSGTQYNAGVAHNSSLDWTHLCLTYDGADVKLYVNGALRATNTSAPDGATLDSNVTISIGSGTRPSAYKISAVKLYNRALSAVEVLQNFNGLRGRYGL